MTNKFLMYDLNAGGFITANGAVQGNDLQNAAMFSEESAKATTLEQTEASFLQIPLTQSFVDELPFDLADTDPNMSHSEEADNSEAMKGDFVVLTSDGFVDEKYNSTTNTSRPKVRGFELDYANLYNADKIKDLGTEWIVEGDSTIIIPVTETQQEKLKMLPEFSPEKEPYGFFMEPIGDTKKIEADAMPDLGSALDNLKAEVDSAELPWSL